MYNNNLPRLINLAPCCLTTLLPIRGRILLDHRTPYTDSGKRLLIAQAFTTNACGLLRLPS